MINKEGEKIKLNRFSTLTVIFGMLCIISIPFYFFNKLDSSYIVLIVGVTQLFSGLSHIKTSKSLDIEGYHNGTKIIGIVISIIGIFLIIATSIRILS